MSGKRFYIYRHIRTDTDEVFYIGKGANRISRKWDYERAYTHYRRNKFWQSVVSKCPDIEVEIVMEFDTEEQCIAKEIELIALYGRRNRGTGTLVNLTDGGDGTTGRICTEELRQKRRERVTGSKHPSFGKQLSAETRRKKSEAINGEKHHLYGKKLPEEWKENIRRSKYGAGNPMYGKCGAEHPNSKPVINTVTGAVYSSVAEAAAAEGVNVKTLYQYLDGTKKNKTPLQRMRQ